jgi:hypothetical protein
VIDASGIASAVLLKPFEYVGIQTHGDKLLWRTTELGELGRAILRNYINATVGFRQLEEATSIPANSLMRMFGPDGNPSAKNLFGVLAHLQAQEGVSFEIRARRS